jgi:hypothetical protein
MSFQNERNDTVGGVIKLMVLDMPGNSIIIGLPHILRHYLDLFVTMLTSGAKIDNNNNNNSEDSTVVHLLNNINTRDEPGLVEPFEISRYEPCMEEVETHEPSDFGGVLYYLNCTPEENLARYRECFEKHVAPGLFDRIPEFKTYLDSAECHQAFIPEKWEGINGFDDLDLKFSPDMPTHRKPNRRVISPALQEAAEKEFRRLKTYMYTESIGQHACEIVIAPKATEPFIRFAGDFRPVNQYIERPQLPIPNVLQQLTRAMGYSYYLDLDMKNSFHQMRISY